jgi:Methenyl tetrahydrofolate cyclohydrolase
MLIDRTVQEFLTELKSASPAPGGGSAAALTGAVGAALTLMVGNLTVGSDKYREVQSEVKALLATLEEQLVMLERFVDEDTAVFNQVMAAYRLPKATDEEQAARRQTVQQALKQAAALPMTVAECCLEVLDLARRMLEIGNASAASDAAVAGRLTHAAMWAAVYNVRINLGGIKDQEFVANMRQRLDSILDRAGGSLAGLLEAADRKIGV